MARPPRPRRRAISFTGTPDEHLHWWRQADALDMSLSAFVRHCIRYWEAEHDDKEPDVQEGQPQ